MEYEKIEELSISEREYYNITLCMARRIIPKDFSQEFVPGLSGSGALGEIMFGINNLLL